MFVRSSPSLSLPWEFVVVNPVGWSDLSIFLLWLMMMLMMMMI